MRRANLLFYLELIEGAVRRPSIPIGPDKRLSEFDSPEGTIWPRQHSTMVEGYMKHAEPESHNEA